jgi:hypothetical protein
MTVDAPDTIPLERAAPPRPAPVLRARTWALTSNIRPSHFATSVATHPNHSTRFSKNHMRQLRARPPHQRTPARGVYCNYYISLFLFFNKKMQPGNVTASPPGKNTRMTFLRRECRLLVFLASATQGMLTHNHTVDCSPLSPTSCAGCPSFWRTSLPPPTMPLADIHVHFQLNEMLAAL